MTDAAANLSCAAGAVHLTLDEIKRRGPLWPSAWVAIGNFDGLHVGHQRILRTAVAQSSGGAVPIALTFSPHPRAVVGSGAPPALMTLEARVAFMRALGVACTVVLRFDVAVARLSAAGFVRAVLVDGLAARGVVVGYNFRFGHRAQGNPELLKQLGEQHGFAVHVVDAIRSDGDVVSSSLVRRRLLSGDVEGAARLLGRAFRLSGRVVAGDRRGRTLGFPTANIEPEANLLLPAEGVYRVRFCPAGAEPMAALAVISNRPTFTAGPVALEVHVLDYQGDLYGQRVDVDFLDRVRGIVRFSSPEELRRQIEQDVAEARARFAAEG